MIDRIPMPFAKASRTITTTSIMLPPHTLRTDRADAKILLANPN